MTPERVIEIRDDAIKDILPAPVEVVLLCAWLLD